ncbi:MAG: hypothetical protein EBS17_08475, partial [Flavobacteriia bacterium]|nr:hypothetical protein [Flavobacteriia bacterium]
MSKKKNFLWRVNRLQFSIQKRKRQFLLAFRALLFFGWKAIRGEIRLQSIQYDKLLPVKEPAYTNSIDILGVCHDVNIFLYRYMVVGFDSFYLYRKMQPTPRSFSLHLPQKTKIQYIIPKKVFGVLWIPLTNFYHCLKDIYIQMFLQQENKLDLPFLFIGAPKDYHRSLHRLAVPGQQIIDVPNGSQAYHVPSYYVFRRGAWDIYDPKANRKTWELWEKYISEIKKNSLLVAGQYR